MRKTLVGIDPGLTGAIAIIYPDESLATNPMPVVPKPSGKNEVSGAGVREILSKLDLETTAVFIELTNAMPAGRGKRGMGAASAFNFGKASGVVRGVVEAMGFRWYEITPVVWKRAAGLIKQDKDMARSKAQALFPLASFRFKKDVGKAEAALIAYHGARLKEEV